MSWRKNVLSYLLWTVYTIMVGIALAGVGNIFCDDMRLPAFCGALFAVFLAAALGGAAFLLHRSAPGLIAGFQKTKAARVSAEAVPAVIMLVLGVILRVEGLQDAEQTAVYYDMAEVTMGQGMPQIAHGAVHVYVFMLHLMFLFLGNHYALGIIAQMIFQGIAALLLYFLIRRYIGVITALVFAGFVSCAPYMVQEGLVLSPDMLYLCLLSAAGALLAGFWNGYGGGTAGRRPAPLLFVLAGIVCSAPAYLDVAGVLLLFLAVGLIFCVNRGRGAGGKAVSALCCVLGFAFGFAGCAWADSLASAKSLGSVLQVWFRLYRPENFRLYATAGMRDYRMESLVLLGLMALGICSFWFSKKKERLAVYMLAALAVIFADGFGIFTEEMPGTLFLYLLFVIMAGIGLQQCFESGEPGNMRNRQAKKAVFWKKAAESRRSQANRQELINLENWPELISQESQENKQSRENQEDMVSLESLEEPISLESLWNPEVQEGRGSREDMMSLESREELISLESLWNSEVQEGRGNQRIMENCGKQTDQGRKNVQEQPETSGDASNVREPEGKKEIRFLENPLPLPRKHEKRVLDYDYQVADEDDFDI